MKKLLLTLLLAPSLAQAQVIGSGPGYQYRTVVFTTPGAWSWIAPADVNAFDVLALVGGGGAGGGGQASAGTAGGAGGTAGISCSGMHYAVTPGATVSGAVGAAGTLAAAGSAGGNGGDTTITGMLDAPTMRAGHGNGGAQGAAGTGGSTAVSAFSTLGWGGFTATASGVAANFAANTSFPTAAMMPMSGGGWCYDGMTGGAGGNTATVGQSGGAWKSINGGASTPGSGNGAGGGGGDSYFSHGQNGTAAGVGCSASPTWTGLAGAGGCGGGTNAVSGPGQAGGVRLGYWTTTGQ